MHKGARKINGVCQEECWMVLCFGVLPKMFHAVLVPGEVHCIWQGLDVF